jgi:hypothetical protein
MLKLRIPDHRCPRINPANSGDFRQALETDNTPIVKTRDASPTRKSSIRPAKRQLDSAVVDWLGKSYNNPTIVWNGTPRRLHWLITQRAIQRAFGDERASLDYSRVMAYLIRSIESNGPGLREFAVLADALCDPGRICPLDVEGTLARIDSSLERLGHPLNSDLTRSLRLSARYGTRYVRLGDGVFHFLRDQHDGEPGLSDLIPSRPFSTPGFDQLVELELQPRVPVY